MTARWVLDTSVVLKWIRQDEVLADRALALLSTYLNGLAQIMAPSLLAYEVANVLRYKTDLTDLDVETAIQALYDLDLVWVPPTAAVMRHATAMARKYDTTVYDAVFAAVAASAEAEFITADGHLARRLAAFPYVHFLGDLEIPT